jgi:DNA-binding response OmpR family regulator
MTEKPWVLVVEDDPEMREEILVPGLRGNGFNATGAGSAMEAYRCLLERTYQLVVLDVMLPDQDGFTVAAQIRASTRAGIVMLSGTRLDADDRVRGLDGGADAYIAKPVGIPELAATLRSVLRRLGNDAAVPGTPSAGGWQLEMNDWVLVSPDDRRVRLGRAERQLVQLLAASPGESVSREAIIRRLADDAASFDPQRLEMLVHRLRRKVLEHCERELPLGTVRGVGYVLNLQ